MSRKKSGAAFFFSLCNISNRTMLFTVVTFLNHKNVSTPMVLVYTLYQQLWQSYQKR
jgi:hypothetical protein